MGNQLISLLLFISWACQTRSSDQSSPAVTNTPSTTTINTSIIPDTLCFRQIFNRDTTTLRLIIDGTEVTGFLDINSYEKDRAKGPVVGTITRNRIQTDWLRSGEGVTQPYVLTMVREGDTLSWREGEYINKQGKWVLKDPNEGYLHKLIKADCTPGLLR